MATLRVSTQKIRSTASEFRSVGNAIKTLTSGMTNTVNTISETVWQGDAANAYKRKFKALDDDIALLLKMINEHVEDLNNIAQAYEQAESENAGLAESLNDNIIS